MFSFLIHFFHLFFFIALVCLFFCVCVFVLLQIFSRFFLSCYHTHTCLLTHAHTHTFISVCFYNVSLNYVVSFNLRNYSFLCFFLFFSFLYNYLFVSFVVAVCFNLLVCHVSPLPSAKRGFCCVLCFALNMFSFCFTIKLVPPLLAGFRIAFFPFLIRCIARELFTSNLCPFLFFSFVVFLCCYMCAFSVDFCS